MNRKARGFRPLANPLEPKLLLSRLGAPWLGRVARAAATPIFAPRNLPVNTIQGGYSGVGNLRLADVPLDATINGTGWVKGLGHVRLTGSLALGGYRRPGESYVTLSNARGTITVRLNDEQVTEPVPDSTFKVKAYAESGTGAYKDIHRVETATVTFGPNTVHAQSKSLINPIAGTLVVKLDVIPPRR